MTRPRPTPVYHFTHVSNMPSLIANGLHSDSTSVAAGLVTEIGSPGIKDRRRTAPVNAGPGGEVSDYAPFYYAPRSPMLFSLHRQGLLEETGGQSEIVYLESSVERLRELGCELVYTDRNAVYEYAAHTDLDDDLDDLIEWPLIRARYWGDYIDGKERRMAECLVHKSLPWEGTLGIVARTQERAQHVRNLLTGHRHQPAVRVEPDWYF